MRKAQPMCNGGRALRVACTLGAATIVACLLAPAGSAHGSSLGENGVFRMQGHYVFLDVTPAWAFAGQNVRFEGSVHRLDGSLAMNATLELSFQLGGVSQGPFAMAWTGDRTPHVLLDHAFPAAGTWTLLLEVREGDVTGTARDTLPVYPVIPWFVLGEGPAAFEPGPATLAIGVRAVDGQPPGPDVQDLRARITRLADGANWTVAASAVDAPWHWRAETEFQQAGDHIVEFASVSGRFGFGDMPPLDIDVEAAPSATTAPPSPPASSAASSQTSSPPSPSASASPPEPSLPAEEPAGGGGSGAAGWLVAIGASAFVGVLAWMARRR